MAVTAQLPAALRIGGSNTSLVANQITWGVDVNEIPKNTFAMVPFTETVAGLKRFTVSTVSYADYAAGGSDEISRAYIGTIQPFSLAPMGDLAGNLAVVGQGLLKSYKAFNAKVGDIADLGLDRGGTGFVAEGLLSIDGATTRTATTTGTAVQVGAITAGKAVYAACHLTTFAGTITSVTFSLQADNASGFPSPVTVATGPALTAVGGTWLTSSAVLADDWWRVVATVVGASPSFVVAAAIAVL